MSWELHDPRPDDDLSPFAKFLIILFVAAIMGIGLAVY
jgi:hypothetical protein